MLLPFDAHNHVQLSPTSPVPIFKELKGMAIQSTHPRDWQKVQELTASSDNVVACYGVHPWFLHECEDDSWISLLEEQIEANPQAQVGEIGLDGFHFDPVTKELCSPLPDQLVAFEEQYKLAAKYQRSVSIHAVQCTGLLMESLSRFRQRKIRPRSVYFHAFGGKPGTVKQLQTLCPDCYFGFAPVVNMGASSQKTRACIATIGLYHLVLESDHEDATRVVQDLYEGVKFIADVLGCSQDQVLEQTYRNAQRLYNLD